MIEVIKRIYFFEKIIKFVCECNRRNQLLKGCSDVFFFVMHVPQIFLKCLVIIINTRLNQVDYVIAMDFYASAFDKIGPLRSKQFG